ncbi:ATP synthase subunit delta [Asanoa siamensis]|uniref:ATP synthase subunit delta n=2 Tax=Asanoa siamensis TaxID=926357 RepID=A0ABQ4CWM6_9ACTN|nr:F0F1 ATP synthase subunit delta [Asanoa siamensis]GIF75699.1 ATP synthase subunit delta [Asanoa siamensis]
MQGVSRESYRAAAERLDSYAASAPAADVATTGDELLSVADVLRRQPTLRRALSDPGRPGDDRAELIRSLLTGKVGDETLGVATVLAGGRWSAATELLDATERLGVEALLASADRADDLAEVEDELFRFGQVVDGSPELSGALSDLVAPPAQRADLAKALLDGKAKPVTLRLVEVALAGFGGRSFQAALSRMVEMSAERRDRQVAYVTVAAPLSDDEERRLGTKLSQLYGRDVTVKQTVDPQVLGGMSVLVGSDLYDGTVLRRLNDTRKALSQR